MDCVYCQVRFINFVSKLKGFSNRTKYVYFNSKYTRIYCIHLLAFGSGISLLFLSFASHAKGRSCFGLQLQLPVAWYRWIINKVFRKASYKASTKIFPNVCTVLTVKPASCARTFSVVVQIAVLPAVRQIRCYHEAPAACSAARPGGRMGAVGGMGTGWGQPGWAGSVVAKPPEEEGPRGCSLQDHGWNVSSSGRSRFGVFHKPLYFLLAPC